MPTFEITSSARDATNSMSIAASLVCPAISYGYTVVNGIPRLNVVPVSVSRAASRINRSTSLTPPSSEDSDDDRDSASDDSETSSESSHSQDLASMKQEDESESDNEVESDEEGNQVVHYSYSSDNELEFNPKGMPTAVSLGRDIAPLIKPVKAQEVYAGANVPPAILLSTNTPTKHNIACATRVVLTPPMDVYWSPTTFKGKSNRKKMNDLLVRFGENPTAEKWKSLRVDALAIKLGSLQKLEAERKTAILATQQPETEEESQTEEAERTSTRKPVARPSKSTKPSKRSREVYADEDVGAASKKLKVENSVNAALKALRNIKKSTSGSISRSHAVANQSKVSATNRSYGKAQVLASIKSQNVQNFQPATAENEHKDQVISQPVGLESVTRYLHAIKRATLKDIQQRPSVSKNDNGMDIADSEDTAETNENDIVDMTIKCNPQGKPLISYEAQVLVRNIISLRHTLQETHKDQPTTKEKNPVLHTSLIEFKRNLENLKTHVSQEIAGAGVDSMAMAASLINRIFAHDIEHGQV